MSIELYKINNKALSKIGWEIKSYRDSMENIGVNIYDTFTYQENGVNKSIRNELEKIHFPRIPTRIICDGGGEHPYEYVIYKYLQKHKCKDNRDYREKEYILAEQICKTHYKNMDFMKKNNENYIIEQNDPFSGSVGVEIYERNHYSRDPREKDECKKLFELWTPELFYRLRQEDELLYKNAKYLYDEYKEGWFYCWSV